MLFSLALAALSLLPARGESRVLSSREDDRGAAYWAVVPRPWIDALKPLLAKRESEGLSTAVLPLDLFPHEDAAKRSEAIREFFRSGAKRWKEKPRFLLLAAAPQEKGILPFSRDWSKEDVKALESFDLKPYRSVASDQPFAQLDEDELPDFAVGRLPARSAEELRAMAEKILAYEKSPPGLWRRRILLLGGLFGEPSVDAVVEAAVAGLLDREIPYDFDLQVLRAEESSPYGMSAGKVREFFEHRLEDGALIAIYAGHANPGVFSTPVPGKKEWEDLFTLESVRSLKIRRGAPLLLSFACHAGGFALESKGRIRETLADACVRHPQGPVAYIGASGISHPIPDLLLAHEMTRLFGQRQELRLGELLVEAKKAAASNGDDEFHKQVAAGAGLFGFGEEKRRNLLRFELWIYNLHGDPALRLQRPEGKIDLSFRPVEGQTVVEVKGKVEGWNGGDALVSIERPRATPPDRGASWKQANDKSVAKGGAEIRDGRFVARLALDAPLSPGRYFLKAYASSESEDASGCLRIDISQ